MADMARILIAYHFGMCSYNTYILLQMTSRKYFRGNIHGPGFLLSQAIQMSRKADRRKVSPVQNFSIVSTIST